MMVGGVKHANTVRPTRARSSTAAREIGAFERDSVRRARGT